MAGAAVDDPAPPRCYDETMADDPPAFIRFHTTEMRVEIYQLALELAARLYTVVELAELERYYLRDALDKKSTAIPVLIARGLAVSGAERREHFAHARRIVTDCAAILDTLRERGTIEAEAIGPARTLVSAMLQKLDAMTYRFGAG
jgi:hypothetical protein